MRIKSPGVISYPVIFSVIYLASRFEVSISHLKTNLLFSSCFQTRVWAKSDLTVCIFLKYRLHYLNGIPHPSTPPHSHTS
jgi:thiamine transporter ThiT